MTPQQRDALRDKLAGLLGWKFGPCDHFVGDPEAWFKADGSDSFQHPIPDADLNALAAIWAERLQRWSWWRMRGYWFAFSGYEKTSLGIENKGLRVPDTGDEYCDRLALTVACFEAERTQKA